MPQDAGGYQEDISQSKKEEASIEGGRTSRSSSGDKGKKKKRKDSERKRKPARKERSGSGDKDRPGSAGSNGTDDDSHKLPTMDAKPEPGPNSPKSPKMQEASAHIQPPSGTPMSRFKWDHISPLE
jgi:hypothetical protein